MSSFGASSRRSASLDDDDDLVTAQSDVGEMQVVSPTGVDIQMGSPEEGEVDLELDAHIQRIFAETFDPTTKGSMATGIALEAIEAQIDEVIRNVGAGSAERTAMDEAILARFRAKNLSVEESLAGPCEAGRLPEPTTRVKRPAIPPALNTPLRDALYAVFLYLALPVAVLTAVLLVYSVWGLKLCGLLCPCSLGESFTYGFTFYFVTELARCVVFSFALEELMRAVRDKQPRRSCIPLMVKPQPWAFAAVSLAFSVGLYSVVMGTMEPPIYMLLPLRVLVVAVPPLVYGRLKRSLPAAGPVVWLQLIPLAFDLIIPSYTAAPLELIVVWPLVVALLDRMFLYLLGILMPSTAGSQIRTLAVHVQGFVSQAVVVAMPLALSVHDKPILVVLYGALLLLTEVVLSAHWLDQAILLAANAIHRCTTKTTPSTPYFHFGGFDVRLMSAYSRHATGVLAVLVMVPLLSVDRWPVVRDVTTCEGYTQLKHSPWPIFGMVCGVHALAIGISIIRRAVSGALVRPLLLSCPFWTVGVAVYLVLSAPDHFGYAA